MAKGVRGIFISKMSDKCNEAGTTAVGWQSGLGVYLSAR
jgi:hypothetical protein